MKKLLYFLLLFFTSTILIACNGQTKNERYIIYLENVFSIVPTVDIRADNRFLTSTRKQQIKDDLNEIVLRLDNIFNVQVRTNDYTKSELMKINESAGIRAVKVSPEVIEVLKISNYASVLSICDSCNDKPLFDPTIAPVWDEWGFTLNYFSYEEINYHNPPRAELIKSKLNLVDFKKVIINEEDSTVFLQEPNMKIDLGGIVKGYAADKVKEYLVSIGIKKAIIDIGGNIHTIGTGHDQKYNDRPWKLGIQTPYYNPLVSDLPNYLGVYEIDDQTIVTSGIYERYIKDESGKEYHHILDPRTGYPIDNSVVSTTIITNNSALADALSTVIFSLGLSEGMKVVEELDNVEAVFVVRNLDKYEVYISSGAEQNFQYLDAMNDFNYIFKGVYKGE